MNPTLNQTIKRIITEVSSDVNNEELVDLTCAGGNINPISSPPPNNAKVAGIVHLWSHPCGPWLYPYSLGSTPTGSKVYVSEQTDLIAGLTPTSPIEQRSQAYYDQVVSQSGPISAGDVLHLSESACWGAAPHSCIRYEGTTNSGTNSSLLFQGVAYHGGPFGSCGDCGVDIPATNHGCQDPNALNTQPHPNYNGPTGTYNGTWGTPPSQGNCQGSWSQQTYYLPLYQNTGGIMTTTGNNPNNAGNPSPQPWCIPKFIHASHVSCCNYNAGCIDNGMFSNSPTPGVPALNYDPNANGDCGSKPCSENEAWISDHGCCTYDAVVDKEGCDDPTALNYGICCDGDPNCTPTISNPKCCRYEDDPEERGCIDPIAINNNTCCPGNNYLGCIPSIPTNECCKYDRVNEDKGCLDPNALNYNECCDGDPNCTVIGSNPECCRYEEDPEPCKKCCCKKGDHIPIGQKCAPGTHIMLSPTTNPCECPKGTIETPAAEASACKPTGPGGPIDVGVMVAKKNPVDYVPDSETPIDKSLAEEIKRYRQLL